MMRDACGGVGNARWRGRYSVAAMDASDGGGGCSRDKHPSASRDPCTRGSTCAHLYLAHSSSSLTGARIASTSVQGPSTLSIALWHCSNERLQQASPTLEQAQTHSAALYPATIMLLVQLHGGLCPGG
jgi:hypothetical protein